eukprot:364525-Chlamydomonas_euryale.AAC.6
MDGWMDAGGDGGGEGAVLAAGTRGDSGARVAKEISSKNREQMGPSVHLLLRSASQQASKRSGQHHTLLLVGSRLAKEAQPPLSPLAHAFPPPPANPSHTLSPCAQPPLSPHAHASPPANPSHTLSPTALPGCAAS